ncbi:Clan CA, family C19, ubiquitin hydrolase-like cysteine peptidase [Trichomonas vaginalis G3]|uniref:Ubiquitin carboxyl-terminal hydrolase n=1 Tax=Trichomonas vaginalis (strain ATCC PRA-98 / G3) TaxID=412133 RepID=A2D7N0_TRIV3|nr:ubiquitin carboxyl-terminal hydrolase family [Trichomonas vaginalis G3]EAY23747.1 Clan CA, family C19, ubiquitin hydrolase-like cysteine peptidase [Trichomonas vaginalis G3]KAI5490242.1 ubiquitin carboxyl-terminal hydrolase family [Trichomonas vaginalis G3]|eukprot:XP_001276995.1 Clan CA, family C19, ubiquitin hydrolase-like cysteine peptidase [Trichomonas vaginalis G3]
MDEQRKQLKAVMSTTQLTPEQNAYLISIKWFNEFKRIIGFETDIALNEKIPAIDNSGLLRNGLLRRDIRENTDFAILTKPTWLLLKQYYGGGPDIGVKVAYNPLKHQNCAITRNIALYILYQQQRKQFSVTTYEKVREIKDRALVYYNLTDKSLNLYEYNNNNIENKLEDDKLLCEYAILDNQQLILTTAHSKKKEEPQSIFSYFSQTGTCTPGTTGLNNMGNTCFMNSTLQCLMHIELLANYFANTPWQKEISTTNPLGTKGELSIAFSKLLEISQRGSHSSYTPSEVRKAIIKHAPNFDGYSQQDAHEVLLFILDGIHEDLNRITKKPQVDVVEGDGTNDNETAIKAWHAYKQRNDSIIVDLFHGQLRSHLKCPNCQADTVAFDPFVSLSVPVPQKKILSPAFIFCPADPTQPRKIMQFNIDMSWSPLQTKRFIQKSEGRNLNLIYAAINHEQTEITYTLSPYRPPSTHILYAIELPSTDKLYAPVFLKEKEKGWIWDGDTPIAGPFLVPVLKQNPSEKELNDIISNYFSFLFDTKNPDPQEMYDKYEETRQKWRSLRDDKNKFEISIRSNFFDSGTFTPLTKMPCLTRRCVDVIVNPSWMTKESGFKWSLFIPSRIKEFEEPVEEKSIDLEKCLDLFSEELVLDEENKWFCPKCREFVQASKKMDIWTSPEILIIHLKRFAQISGFLTKNETEVQYPDELDMSQRIIGPHNGSCKYKLIAVSEHHGILGSGHYTAHAMVGNQWYLFNDSSVSKCLRDMAHTKAAYVLFYAKIHE